MVRSRILKNISVIIQTILMLESCSICIGPLYIPASNRTGLNPCVVDVPVVKPILAPPEFQSFRNRTCPKSELQSDYTVAPV